MADYVKMRAGVAARLLAGRDGERTRQPFDVLRRDTRGRAREGGRRERRTEERGAFLLAGGMRAQVMRSD